jgi:RNA polymerase sigma-70 factor, ECF subfamily
VDLEQRIRSSLDAKDFRAAATLAVEEYGPEVLGFLISFLHDENDATEAFSQTCTDLWSGLPRFEGRSSFRTWFYVLARHAASRLRRSPHRRGGRNVPISEVTDIAEVVRSRTMPHLLTAVKSRFAAIREALPEEDRALLVLRVDRNMSWNDIARVLYPDDSAEELARASARLRKRFQLLKDEIRALAREVGLVPEEEA